MYQQPNNQQPPPNTYYPPQQPWQQSPMMPPPPPQRPPKKKQNPWLIVGILAALLVVGAAINNAAHSSPQATDNTVTAPTATPTDTPLPTFGVTPVPTDTPAPPPKWTTTQTFSGSGDKKTAVFSVPDDWKILWSCTDNTGYNVGGVFYVEVYNSDNTEFDLSAVSAQCAPGKTTRDSTEEHQSGEVYLKIIDGLPWTIQVQELK